MIFSFKICVFHFCGLRRERLLFMFKFVSGVGIFLSEIPFFQEDPSFLRGHPLAKIKLIFPLTLQPKFPAFLFE